MHSIRDTLNRLADMLAMFDMAERASRNRFEEMADSVRQHVAERRNDWPPIVPESFAPRLDGCCYEQPEAPLLPPIRPPALGRVAHGGHTDYG